MPFVEEATVSFAGSYTRARLPYYQSRRDLFHVRYTLPLAVEIIRRYGRDWHNDSEVRRLCEKSGDDENGSRTW